VNTQVAVPAVAAEPPLRLAADTAARRVALALGAIVALGAVVRFGSLGVQSYHHDEVITVMRVIPGSFGEMLHKLKVSESNPLPSVWSSSSPMKRWPESAEVSRVQNVAFL